MSKGVTIRQRGKYYEYRFEIASVNGKRQWLTKSGFLDRDEALVAGEQAKREYENGGSTFEPKKMSYSDYLDFWIKNSKDYYASNTIESYSSHIKLYIKPGIGHYDISTISDETLKNFVRNLVENHSFSKEYFKNIIKTIRASFRDAYNEYDFIDKNPASNLCLPKRISTLSRCKNKHTYSNEEVDSIMERFKDDKLFLTAFGLARIAGLRPGEVYALTWDCIDFDNKKINIKRNVSCKEKDDKGRWYFGPVKGKRARTIPMCSTLEAMFLKIKENQEMYKELLGDKYKYYHQEEIKYDEYGNFKSSRIVENNNSKTDHTINFIYTREDGTYSGKDVIKYPMKLIHTKMGLKDCKFYDNRGTYATILVNEGIDIKGVSDTLGHSSTDITKRYYLRDIEEEKYSKMRRTVKKAEKLLVTDKMKEYLTK